MAKKVSWILLVALAIIIGLYPSIYFFIDRKFGLLSSKSAALLTNTFWNIGFYTHIVLGGIALLIGWTQFSSKMRLKNLTLHKQIGKVYLIAVMVSSIAGFYIGFFATGGLLSSLGFISLAIVWFSTTLNAYLHIKNKRVEQHQQMMVYSYAACFAAVTLRIWLPFLTIIYGDFLKAYTIVAWLCWIPNILIAYLINRRLVGQKI